MKLLHRRTVCIVFFLCACASSAFAQDSPSLTTVPNPMGAHTFFIIAAIGAFLLWCISYTLQVQKESLAKKKGRDDLLRQKEDLLNRIANLEDRRETNAVPDPQYRRAQRWQPALISRFS